MEIINRFSEYFAQERNKTYTWAGALGGGFFSAHLLSDTTGIWTFVNAESIVKASIGIVIAGMTGLATKMGADLWSIKIKPKIFKNGKQQKEDDNQRRA